MLFSADERVRVAPQRQKIVESLRKAGIEGVTNIELYKIGKKITSRISELREQGYQIDQEQIKSGVHRYYLISEPLVPLPKPIRPEDLLVQEIKNLGDSISVKQFKRILLKHNLMITRKSGALKNISINMGVSQNKNIDFLEDEQLTFEELTV